MKILKIALQNINSLKSKAPIVIDFENNLFKDVGLFAITGATGAGKTTILDAITIALYHNVPRFNGAKGTLIDVISHNAKSAFSAVTFKNNNTIYEAFWGIKIADKNGKMYKNPKEEVSLKNLTSGIILASQKRNVIEAVANVTQLDYYQFLRSVMLAQGEFASFLTAKGPEKGKLLEQITGEGIYKKIGQGILERKAAEENKLKEIVSKINADDVLNEVQKAALITEDKTLNTTIETTEKQLKKAQIIADWYQQEQKLSLDAKQHEEDAKNIDAFVVKHQTTLNALALHEKAMPFKELVKEINRIEKEIHLKGNLLNQIDSKLAKLEPEIHNLEAQTKAATLTANTAEQDFKLWLPKFDTITKLDTDLKNEIVLKEKATENKLKIELQENTAKTEKEQLLKSLEVTNTSIKTNETYLQQNTFIQKVALEITTWRADFIALKTNQETLQTTTLLLKNKEVEFDKTAESLIEKNKILLEKKAIILAIENKITNVNLQLATNNFADLIAQKEQYNLEATNWIAFKNIAEQHQKTGKEKEILEKDITAFTKDLTAIKVEIKEQLKVVETHEKQLADATKIVDLEKSIAKYEADRKHLVAGNPCGLCGSTEHPFTAHVMAINITESEIEVRKRKERLQQQTEFKLQLTNKETQLTTRLESFQLQVEEKEIALNLSITKAKAIPITCNLSDFNTIENELIRVQNKLTSLQDNLKIAQQLQLEKDDLLKKQQAQNEEIHVLKTTIATLEEKNKNSAAEVEQHKNVIKKLSSLCKELEESLKVKLSKFNYKLPILSEINNFLNTTDESIAHYNLTEKKLEALKATYKNDNIKLKHVENQLESYSKSKEEFAQILKDAGLKHTKLIADRNAILPETISVENKRNSLQNAITSIAEKLRLSKENLQKLLDAKTKNATLKEDYTKDLKELTNQKQEVDATLNTQLKSSEFSSKENIEIALLSDEKTKEYALVKERIRENLLKIKTLKEENTKAYLTLKEVKNFEVSLEENQENLNLLKTTKDSLSAKKGEIKEAFRKDQEIRNRNAEVSKKIDEQELICATWKALFKIIGNSKDAFNIYVQRLTLKQLLALANVHLYKLNKRYSLKMEEDYKPKEELNFNLIDHYQTDQERLVDTSSGGEKFIISLALALGLSDLASKNVKIESLFIDEGFGTLDSNTLDTVISTLETLQSQGKMIGIISHVENLKERIPTQIQITKKSNGVSSVAIV